MRVFAIPTLPYLSIRMISAILSIELVKWKNAGVCGDFCIFLFAKIRIFSQNAGWHCGLNHPLACFCVFEGDWRGEDEADFAWLAGRCGWKGRKWGNQLAGNCANRRPGIGDLPRTGLNRLIFVFFIIHYEYIARGKGRWKRRRGGKNRMQARDETFG